MKMRTGIKRLQLNVAGLEFSNFRAKNTIITSLNLYVSLQLTGRKKYLADGGKRK